MISAYLRNFEGHKSEDLRSAIKMPNKKQYFKVAEIGRGWKEPQSTQCIETWQGIGSRDVLQCWKEPQSTQCIETEQVAKGKGQNSKSVSVLLLFLPVAPCTQCIETEQGGKWQAGKKQKLWRCKIVTGRDFLAERNASRIRSARAMT